VISKFDTTDEPVVFLGYFLLDEGPFPRRSSRRRTVRQPVAGP
jgi:hypothetical protein